MAGNSFEVKVLKLGSAEKTVRVVPGTTIEGAIDFAGYSEDIESGEYTLTFRGVQTQNLNQEVQANDSIILSAKVKGGR